MTIGEKIALAVGIGGLVGAVAIIATNGERFLAVILVFVGASALSGFFKARAARKRSR